MPSKRPPSPYLTTQSPRLTKTKTWRPLSGSGNMHTTNPQLESSREIWLKSLRQGTVEPKHHSRDETFKRKTTEDYWISTFRSSTPSEKSNMRSNPVKAVHGLSGKNQNNALNSSSNYLREQLGITTKTPTLRRSSSFNGGSQPGTPRYKSQEDMYDEIMELKKTITSQKSEFDILKSKIRRSEEENRRKDKCIDQLIEQITCMSEGKVKKGQSGDKLVITTLKQRQMKLESNIKEKDDELQTARERIKALRSKARQAKASYIQEVSQLQDSLKHHEGFDSHDTSHMEFNESAGPSMPSKVKTLRQAVVKLTGDNNRLQEENRSLKRDLERVLDNSQDGDDDEAQNQEPIKYSALDRAELISVIKKNKAKEGAMAQEHKEVLEEEQTRLKKVIRKLKDEINQLRNDKNKQILQIENLEEENEKLKEENIAIVQAQKPITSENRRRKESSQKRLQTDSEVYRRSEQLRRKVAAKSIQRQWRKHKMEQDDETDQAVASIQSALRGHATRQQLIDSQSKPPQYASSSSEFRKARRPNSVHSSSSLGIVEEGSDIDEEIYVEDDDTDIDYLQATMRGHVTRKQLLDEDETKRPSFSRSTTAASSTHWSSAT